VSLRWILRAVKAGGRLSQGQGLVEYALILVFVAVVLVGILALFGPAVDRVFAGITDGMAPLAASPALPAPPSEDSLCLNAQGRGIEECPHDH